MSKILFIVSGATYWVLQDGTRYATGYWAEEFAKPYKIVTDAGHEVVVATPNGVTPNVDMMSLRPEMAGGVQGALELEAIIRSAEVMRRPLKLSDVRLEDYDAVYLPGGHGPMADLAFDADVGRLLTAQLASGNPLFIVCHGPASMLATRIHGVSPFKGYRVTGFTNDEEEGVGVASRATWLLETDLKEKVGVDDQLFLLPNGPGNSVPQLLYALVLGRLRELHRGMKDRQQAEMPNVPDEHPAAR